MKGKERVGGFKNNSLHPTQQTTLRLFNNIHSSAKKCDKCWNSSRIWLLVTLFSIVFSLVTVPNIIFHQPLQKFITQGQGDAANCKQSKCYPSPPLCLNQQKLLMHVKHVFVLRKVCSEASPRM